MNMFFTPKQFMIWNRCFYAIMKIKGETLMASKKIVLCAINPV